jgi:hypothetical protein
VIKEKRLDLVFLTIVFALVILGITTTLSCCCAERAYLNCVSRRWIDFCV